MKFSTHAGRHAMGRRRPRSVRDAASALPALVGWHPTLRGGDLVARVTRTEGTVSSTDAGVGGCELPVGFGVVLVAVVLPCGNFVGSICLSAMRRSRHCDARTPSSDSADVEPAAVLNRVVPFEALDEPAGLGRGKGLIKRGWLVDVEIILRSAIFARIWKMRSGQIPEHVGIIDGCVAVGDLDVPPPFERREREQIGDAIAFVFVIVTRWLSRFGGDRPAPLDDQLLRAFVEAHQGTLGIVRPLIDFQYIFHAGDKGRIGVIAESPIAACDAA